MPKAIPRPSLPQPPAPTRSTELQSRNHQVTAQLAARFDALNAGFVIAETKLKEIKPLRSVWVWYDHDDTVHGPGACDALGLHKLDNTWRLVHGDDHDGNEDLPFDIKPIVECSVEVRIRAAKQVRQLHEKIIHQKEQFIPEVEEAIAELDKYCATI